MINLVVKTCCGENENWPRGVGVLGAGGRALEPGQEDLSEEETSEQRPEGQRGQIYRKKLGREGRLKGKFKSSWSACSAGE